MNKCHNYITVGGDLLYYLNGYCEYLGASSYFRIPAINSPKLGGFTGLVTEGVGECLEHPLWDIVLYFKLPLPIISSSKQFGQRAVRPNIRPVVIECGHPGIVHL